MVQFNILSGKQAGDQWVTRHFPVRIGRAASNDFRLEEDGVWNQHCEVKFSPDDGFTLVAEPNALVTINHQPAQTSRLHNGDSIELGSVRLQFWLSEARQSGLRLREWFVCTLVVGISFAEIALIYWLLK